MSASQPHHGGNLYWAAALAGCLPQEILDFSASINPLGPPQSVKLAIQACIDTIRAYPDPHAQQFKQRLSQLHDLPPEWIIVGNGAAELLTWACRSLSQLSQTHLLSPAFGDYYRALQAFDACVITHPISLNPNGAAADTSDWIGAMNLSLPQGRQETQGILLNNPHNPTGFGFHQSELLSLLEQCALLVVDEAFMEFLPNPAPYSLVAVLARYPNLVIVRSLTKFFSIPGLRLGYALAHPSLIQQWQTWRDPWSVNTLAIAAGFAALDDTAFQAETFHWLNQARPLLHQELAQIPGLTVFPGIANFLLVRCAVSVTQLQLDLLQHHRILIRDCMSFPELGDRYFRVAVRTAQENAQLIQALREAIPRLTHHSA